MLITPQALAVAGAILAQIGGVIGSVAGALKGAAAGTATLSEDAGQFRNVLVLAAMPLTQTFYAMIVMVIILTAVVPNLTTAGQGWMVLFIGILAGIAELFSAYYQGLVCTAGISLLPKTKGQLFTPTILMAAYLELLGIVGMVFAIMAFALLGLM